MVFTLERGWYGRRHGRRAHPGANTLVRCFPPGAARAVVRIRAGMRPAVEIRSAVGMRPAVRMRAGMRLAAGMRPRPATGRDEAGSRHTRIRLLELAYNTCPCLDVPTRLLPFRCSRVSLHPRGRRRGPFHTLSLVLTLSASTGC